MVLIIVLWLCIGLASLALTFGHAAMLEYRAAANCVAAVEAAQIAGAAQRYVAHVLAEVVERGALPSLEEYEAESVSVGDGTFWLIGREDDATRSDRPVFGLVDEASKLNLNTATREMLEALPGMTAELAAAIIDWRDSDSEASPDGAESENYLRRDPAYACKDAPFETLEELRLVMGMDLETLYGKDANRNGIIETWENEGGDSDRTFGLDAGTAYGLAEHLTVYSREPKTNADGEDRTDINGDAQAVRQVLSEALGQERAAAVAQAAGLGQRQFTSLVELYARGGFSIEEFEAIHDDLTIGSDEYREGLVNVNTASAAVLACIPGIDSEAAEQLVSHRLGKEEGLASVGWVCEVLEPEDAVRAGPFITTHSYQFSADVVALGREGHAMCRRLFVFDTSGEAPAVVFVRDLSSLGWPLGPDPDEEGEAILR